MCILLCFNPQASYEARLSFCLFYQRGYCFNPQASYEARPHVLHRLFLLHSVSIHRPHTRPDFLFFAAFGVALMFQSTGLIRGPTIVILCVSVYPLRFNPQASYEARQEYARDKYGVVMFQSTGLIRGPTREHGLCAGDHGFQSTGLIRGPTRLVMGISQVMLTFQSTGLIRGPTADVDNLDSQDDVSIHRPHTRPDSNLAAAARLFWFQSTGLIRGPTFER